MKDSVDPRLIQIIDEAGDDEEVEAVVILDKSAASAADDDRGVGGKVVDRVVEAAHQEPSQVRFLPNLGAVYLKGSPQLVRRLLEADEVQSASSMESGFTLED